MLKKIALLIVLSLRDYLFFVCLGLLLALAMYFGHQWRDLRRMALA